MDRRAIAVVMMLVGLALLVYSAFDYDNVLMAFRHALVYEESAKLRMAAGAVLIAAGAFLYWKRPS